MSDQILSRITPSRPAKTQADPRRWIALAVLLLAGFMNLIDVTIVNVALPSLQTSLGADSERASNGWSPPICWPSRSACCRSGGSATSSGARACS